MFKVVIETRLVVLAEDNAEARRTGIDSLYGEIQANPEMIMVACPIENFGAVPPGWMNRLPWCENIQRHLEGKTVGEILRHSLLSPYNKNRRRNQTR
jgi:hypothetical protein